MLLIDSIIELGDNSITCSKTFQPEEFFLQGHFPDRPIVPGVILCECAAQAGAVLLLQTGGENSGGTPLLTRINDVRLKQVVEPNDTVEVQVTLDEQVSTAYLMSAKVRKNGKVAASLKFTCMIQPAE